MAFGFSLGGGWGKVGLLLAGPMGWGALAAGEAMKALEPEIPRAEIPQTATEGIKINTRKTSAVLPIVYGKQLIGGNDVFLYVSGDDNKTLWIVQTLAEGECSGILEIDGVPQVFVDDRIYTDFGANVSYWFHSGTHIQTVDTNLNTDVPSWTDTLRGTCYIVWKLIYDSNLFQGVPTRQVVLYGKKVWNPVTELTEYSDNAAFCLYDFLYGRGVGTFDVSTLGTTINYCESKNWRLNLALNMDSGKVGDTVNSMLQYFHGRLNWWAGTYYLRYADLPLESSVAAIVDADLILDQSTKLPKLSINQPGRFDRPTGLKAKYLDPDNKWAEDAVAVGETAGRVAEVDLTGAYSRAMAGKLGAYLLERSLLDRTLTLTLPMEWLKLEPGDPITLTLADQGLDAEPMRVVASNLNDDGTVELVIRHDDEALYDDLFESAVATTYDCSLPDITAAPPGIENVDHSEEVYFYRLRSFTRLNVTFDPPSSYPWFDHVEVWRSWDDSAYEHLFNTTGDFSLDPVEELSLYYIKLRVVSIHGVKQSMDDSWKVSRTIQGKIDLPPSLTFLSAIVTGDGINLYADKLEDPDIEIYEFRLGGWSGGVLLAATKAPNLSLKGVKPGSFTFYCDTLGNNGEYGETPVAASAVIPDPPRGWTVQATETCDYSTGTHDNTEQTTYNAEYYLKCSHTGDVLTGTYLSPIYDRGSAAQYLCYVLADIVVTGEGSQWQDKFAAATTWTALGLGSKNWAQIFALMSAPQVKINLWYGETSPPTNKVERMEILSSIVTGRYFQVEVEITDPSSGVFALVEHFSLKFCT